MGKINVAVIGVGNCASSLIQGVQATAPADVIEKNRENRRLPSSFE